MRVTRHLEFAFGAATFLTSLLYPGVVLFYLTRDAEAKRGTEEIVWNFGIFCSLTLIFAIASCYHSRRLNPALWIPMLLAGAAYVFLSGSLGIMVLTYGSALGASLVAIPMLLTFLTIIFAVANEIWPGQDRQPKLEN